MTDHNDSNRVEATPVTDQLTALTQQLHAYARDLKTAFDAERRKSRELERSYYDTVSRLVEASRYRDEETGAHIRRIAHYSRILAEELRLSPRDVETIATAAPLHDLGKIGIPGAILRKAGPLTAAEWEVMRRHTLIGARILEGSHSELIETARVIALTHHERWNGSGYPQGLKAEEIPTPGRIVMLADQYDALRSRRPYKDSLPHEQVCSILFDGDQRTQPEHFDPRLLDVLRRAHRRLEAIYEEFAEE